MFIPIVWVCYLTFHVVHALITTECVFVEGTSSKNKSKRKPRHDVGGYHILTRTLLGMRVEHGWT